jgi:hypothetical protein
VIALPGLELQVVALQAVVLRVIALPGLELQVVALQVVVLRVIALLGLELQVLTAIQASQLPKELAIAVSIGVG